MSQGQAADPLRTETRRTFVAPTSKAVTVVIAVLSILAAGAAAYDIYRIGDSGARATWQGQFGSAPAPKAPVRDEPAR